MKQNPHWTARQMLEHASRGLGKVDAMGLRGVTRVSIIEIEAMACTLAALGLVPIPPGGDAPDRLLINTQED